MDQSQHVKSQLEMSRNFHDVKGIDNLRRAAQSGDKGALQEAANQFEAIFVQMMLKSMRKAQDALADKDSPFNSDQVKFYRDMHDQQLAVDLSSGGGMGLAKLIVQQMSPEREGFTPASVIRSDGNLADIQRRFINTEKQRFENRVEASSADSQFGPSKQAAFSSPQDFVSQLLPQASAYAKELGISPQALIAQAAVETGWGKFMIHDNSGQNSHNLFGLKAGSSWQGDKTSIDTLEFKDGVASKQKAAFRSYGSFTDSLNDYVSFVKDNPRYQQAIEQVDTPKAYFKALQDAGYATDPNYAEKIMTVLQNTLFEPALSAIGDKIMEHRP